MERHFRILDVGLTLTGPESVIAPIAYAYRRFVVDGAGDDFVRFVVDSDASTEAVELRIDDAPAPLLAGLSPTQQVYQQVLLRLSREIGSHAVLHAAALVDPTGDGLLLSGPSGHGKSSLTLEMTRRGFGFLGDDYAPLDLETGRIWPYPRAVSVVPSTSAPIPEALRARALDPDGIRVGGKTLVDVGEVFGEQALSREPAPLRHVVLLTGHETVGPDAGITVVDVACLADDADGFDRTFHATPGVEVLDSSEDRGMRYWRLRLDHERRPTEALSPVLDSERILLVDKCWDLRPEFQGPAEASPVSRRRAAESLGRELLNRRHGGRLMQRYDGRLAPLFLDLAGALREARCWRVAVGGCRETADLIESLVES